MKVDLPGGNWAELRDVDALTGADQDRYFEEHDRLLAARPAAPPEPDPANPAQMLPAGPARLDNADWRHLRDYALGIAVTAWSYELPLPFTAESKKDLPLKACNALYDAVRPVQRALNGADDEDEGDGPKPGAPTGTPGSADTSEAGTPSPLPEPAGEPSGTLQG